jgi:hypothetical protein
MPDSSRYTDATCIVGPFMDFCTTVGFCMVGSLIFIGASLFYAAAFVTSPIWLPIYGISRLVEHCRKKKQPDVK